MAKRISHLTIPVIIASLLLLGCAAGRDSARYGAGDTPTDKAHEDHISAAATEDLETTDGKKQTRPRTIYQRQTRQRVVDQPVRP